MSTILGPHPPIDRLLLDAVVKGQLDAVRAAVEQGAHVNIMTRSGIRGRVDTVDPYGDQSLLDIAVVQHNVDMVKLLLSLGLDPALDRIDDPGQGTEAKSSRSGGINERRNPLRMAIKDGDIPMLQALLAGGVDPDTKSGNGVTALHDVIWYSKPEHASEATRLLMMYGADEHATNSSGYTPMEVARGIQKEGGLWNGEGVATAQKVFSILQVIQERTLLREIGGINQPTDPTGLPGLEDTGTKGADTHHTQRSRRTM